MSPSVTVRRGPGHVPLKPSALSGLLLRVDPVLDLLDRQLEDLHPVLDPGLERLVAVALDLGRLAAEEPVDGRLRGGVVVDRRADGDGAADADAPGSCDASCDGATEGAWLAAGGGVAAGAAVVVP